MSKTAIYTKEELATMPRDSAFVPNIKTAQGGSKKLIKRLQWPCSLFKKDKPKCRAKHCYHKGRCDAYQEPDKHGFNLGGKFNQN